MKPNKAIYGFGTHRLKGQVCIDAVTYALKKGYNLLDTAEKYMNGPEIAEAIRLSKRRRSSFMIVHKLTDVVEFSRSYIETVQKVEQYCTELNTTYLDILLMHGPSPRYHEHPEEFKEGNIEVWKTMYTLKSAGVLKAIGVSNFNKEQILYLIEATGVIPDYLEIQFNVVNADKSLLQFITWVKRLGIKIIAYSPINAGSTAEIVSSHLYQHMLREQNISIGEFALRFCLSHEVIPIPRSQNKKRILENLKSLKKGKL